MNKQEAKEESLSLNETFDNNLCKIHCPKGVGDNQKCLYFLKSTPWLENEAKDTWETSKPECLVGYGS